MLAVLDHRQLCQLLYMCPWILLTQSTATVLRTVTDELMREGSRLLDSGLGHSEVYSCLSVLCLQIGRGSADEWLLMLRAEKERPPLDGGD